PGRAASPTLARAYKVYEQRLKRENARGLGTGRFNLVAGTGLGTVSRGIDPLDQFLILLTLQVLSLTSCPPKHPAELHLQPSHGHTKSMSRGSKAKKRRAIASALS